jgi:hypothetical protein
LKPWAPVWLGILVFLTLAGCRALPPAGPPTAVSSGEELLARLQSRYQNIQSFQARGRITFLSPRQNYAGSILLKGRLPATLRIDVLDFFGRTILNFATDGTQVQMLSPKEGKLFRGPATPRNLASFIPPTVSLTQAVRLLVAAVPFSSGAPQRFTYDPSRGQYLLEWTGPGGALQERLWVESRELYPAEDAWYGGRQEPRFTADFSGFGLPAPGVPEKITIKSASPKMELRLVYQELVLNPSLAPGDLVLQPPPGVAVVPLRP